MPAAWLSLLRTLGVLVAMSGAGAAFAQLGARLMSAPPRWTARLRDGLLATTLVTAASTLALLFYFYLVR